MLKLNEKIVNLRFYLIMHPDHYHIFKISFSYPFFQLLDKGCIYIFFYGVIVLAKKGILTMVM